MKKLWGALVLLAILISLGVLAAFFISPYHVTFVSGGSVANPESPTGYSCSKHGVDLISKPGFFAKGSMMQGTSEYWEVSDAFPGSIPLNGALTETKMHRTPAKLVFCDLCQSGIEKHFAQND